MYFAIKCIVNETVELIGLATARNSRISCDAGKHYGYENKNSFSSSPFLTMHNDSSL